MQGSYSDSTGRTPTWLVTGAARGLGAAIAREALARGHNVAIMSRSPVEAENTRLMATMLDIADPAAVDQALRAIEGRFGGIDILVNNAAMILNCAVEETQIEQARWMFEVNFFASARLIRAVLPQMRERQWGRIINISSMAAISGVLGYGYYSASKSALQGLTEALDEEVREFGIRASVIDLGGFDTGALSRSQRICAEESPYYPTVGARQQRVASQSGIRLADPRGAAEAIVEIALASDPPVRLPIGRDALARTYEALDNRRATVDHWSTLSGNASDGGAMD